MATKMFSGLKERLNIYYAKTAKEYLEDSMLRESFWIANERLDFLKQVMKRIRLKHFGSNNERTETQWMP